jgi:hypothetical protein
MKLPVKHIARPLPGPEAQIGEVTSSLELFQKVYRNPKVPLHTRLRAARDAKDHEHPKLVATAIVNESSFAALLDRAIARSNGHKQIEGAKVENAGSLIPKESQAREVSADHQRQPIKSFMLTRRV